MGPVVDDQPGQDVNVDRHFWDQQAISPGSNGCLEGGEASIATKQAEQDRLAMRPGGRANTIDKLSCPVDGRLKADAVVRPMHIIIHRLGYPPDRNPSC